MKAEKEGGQKAKGDMGSHNEAWDWWGMLEWLRGNSVGQKVVARVHRGPKHPSGCHRNWLIDKVIILE